MTADTRPDCLRPPEATPERVARLEEWVIEYATDIRAMWAENGEDVNTIAAREAFAGVVGSMLCRDIEEWMPLGHALDIKMQTILEPDKVDPDALRNALRTLNTATQEETDAAICNQMGWDQLSLNNFRKDFGEYYEQVGPATESKGGACSLYRYYDEAGRLLYVGIAKDPNMRDNQHRDRSKWHRFSIDRRVEWHDTRNDALRAERDAITTEAPIFNLAHASPAQRSAALDYLFDRLADTA